MSEFSDEDANYILKTFQPLGTSGFSLIEGEVTNLSQSSTFFLSNLSLWFNNDQAKSIGFKIIKKAEDSIILGTDILDLHFLFDSKIQLYYKHRDLEPSMINEVENACIQQFEIAPKTGVEFS